MATPFRKAKISNTFTWSDGSNFTGYLYVALVIPTSGGSDWPELHIDDISPRQRLPLRFIIPIINGAANQNVSLIFNADINPPNSQYGAYIFDSARKQVAGPSSLFTVTADPVAIPALTLTVPIAGSVVTAPDTP